MISTFDLESGHYDLHIGNAPYEVHFTPDRIDAEEESLWGRADHARGLIEIRTRDEEGAKMVFHFVASTVIHEILHAAFYVSGYHVADDAYSEESVAGVLAWPLLQIISDPRNARLLSLLAPKSAKVQWRDPLPRTLEAYYDAVDKVVRDLAEETDVPASVISPDTSSSPDYLKEA